MIVVVIPIYKEEPSHNELISLQQCVKVLGDYNLYLVKPRSLNTSRYEVSDKIRSISFPDRYFQSIDGYNKLLLSPRFYGAFISSEYLLICQLDTFIFSDQLAYWVNKKFDYIGAPWINLSWPDKFKNSLMQSRSPVLRRVKKIYNLDRATPPYVGNGGLSLRKTKKFFGISLMFPLLRVTLENGLNEDAVWSLFVPKYFPYFKIADSNTALQFSMESSPSFCFKKK